MSTRFEFISHACDREHVLETRYTHQARNLTCYNIDRGASHKAADSGGWDELNDPSKPEDTNAEDDDAADERNGGSDRRTVPFAWMCVLNVFDDLGGCQRHDSYRTDRDILGGSEQLFP